MGETFGMNVFQTVDKVAEVVAAHLFRESSSSEQKIEDLTTLGKLKHYCSRFGHGPVLFDVFGVGEELQKIDDVRMVDLGQRPDFTNNELVRGIFQKLDG